MARSGINLAAGQEVVVNLRLDVGEVLQQVSVTSEAPLANTTTAAVSGPVGERQVQDLPLNGRSFDNLITLNSGTVNYTSNKSGPQNGTGEGNYFSVAGSTATVTSEIRTFNHTNFGTPNPIVLQGTTVSSSAGRVTATSTTSRQIQFGLELIF